MTNATDTNKTLGESMFAQCGYAQDAIDKRVSQVWYEIFEGPNKFYWENDEGLAYVMDTGNNDVRTEGMSYAMMIALQYDRKDVFDKLWGWVMRHMYMKDGHHAHYFAWSVAPDGTPNSNGPAPDGEEYFAMDLFLASRRWGDGEDIYEYSAWGREILRYCVHKGERYDGEPMWNPDNKLIKFIPETEWSDPSYHLPHVDESNHWHFYSDAYRTAANIGLDAAWNGPQEVLCDRVAALQRFFLTHDRTSVYAIDGTAVDEVVLHPVGFLAATAQGSLAAVHSAQPDAEHNAREWVRMLWNTPMRTGTRRYYDNFLYAFAMLALSGKYRYE